MEPYVQSGGDVGPQYLGKVVHIKVSQTRTDYQVYHGGHTEQLRLVDRDLSQYQLYN